MCIALCWNFPGNQSQKIVDKLFVRIKAVLWLDRNKLDGLITGTHSYTDYRRLSVFLEAAMVLGCFSWGCSFLFDFFK